MYVNSCKVPFFLGYNRTWIFKTDCRKLPKRKIPRSPCRGSRVPCGRTGRWTWRS